MGPGGGLELARKASSSLLILEALRGAFSLRKPDFVGDAEEGEGEGGRKAVDSVRVDGEEGALDSGVL
jgi:hypothetical protein